MSCWSPQGWRMNSLLFHWCIYCHNTGALVACCAQVVTVKNWSNEGNQTQYNQIFTSLFSLSLSAGNCPKPIKNRDVVSLRSWQVMDDEYIIVNFSVKHPVRHLLHTLPCTQQPRPLNLPFLQAHIFLIFCVHLLFFCLPAVLHLYISDGVTCPTSWKRCF